MEILTGTLGIEVVDDKDPQHSISIDFAPREWETLDGYELSEELSYNLFLLHWLFYSYVINQMNLTVVCDYGREIIFKEKIAYDLRKTNLMLFTEDKDLMKDMTDLVGKKLIGELTDEEIKNIMEKNPLVQKLVKKRNKIMNEAYNKK